MQMAVGDTPPSFPTVFSTESKEHCRLPASSPARLIVVIDTEEEFDWSHDFSRKNTSVSTIRHIHRVQSIFDRYGITPVYVVDYPIISKAEAYVPLREIYSSGRCLIGAHLHPWVNPPYEEEVTRHNSFPGNLPRQLEADKLARLRDGIAERFGVTPTIYKAGRYGVGANTAQMLINLGFDIDLSVCPYMDYSVEGGPDFSNCSFDPYWIQRPSLLELPLTVGFSGVLRRWGGAIHRGASSKLGGACRSVGLLARTGLLNKVWLSPEGFLSSEHIALTRALFADGLRVFSFAFHSPSVVPGHTPYVRSERDLETFLSRCDRFFDFFMGTLGGCPSTPHKLKHEFLDLTS